jgi:hypothetical protein
MEGKTVMKKKKILIAVCLFILVVALQAPAIKSMEIKTEKNVVTVQDKNVLMRYRYKDVPYKPYVQELYSPNGINVLRDAPHDHLHHHALMYAIAVDGVNFWEEQNAPGQQKHIIFTGTSARTNNNTSNGCLTERLDWINPRNGELLLKESRTIRIIKPKKHKVTILCWQSSFIVPDGKDSVTLSGSHYFGLGMRFVESMDTGGEFFNAAGKEGEVVRGDERITRANWCAYTAKANGKTVTVAMFGDPDNLRHPTHWFTMRKPFAYLSATLNLYKETLDISSEEPLRLHYAVVVWDNRVGGKQVQRVYDWWVKRN